MPSLDKYDKMIIIDKNIKETSIKFTDYIQEL